MSDSIFKPFKPSKLKKPALNKALLLQASVALMLAAGVLLVNVNVGLSLFCAILIFTLPQAYLNFKAFAYYGTSDIDRIKSGLYLGEFYKVVLSCALFVTSFIAIPELLHFPTLFIGYILMIIVNVVLTQFQINHPS
ncbi:ATP synthase subunit I [Marinicellulosiphila megalodicopiae]|uniref:ATP synthase subunit I n=1 Tax=Marinicellulosiphila megalodicopiae TaxID=2724896 RepID=UPI003BAE48F7